MLLPTLSAQEQRGEGGAPGTLSDTQRWQVTMIVRYADKLPPAAQSVLAH
jgi:hypothetical protein